MHTFSNGKQQIGCDRFTTVNTLNRKHLCRKYFSLGLRWHCGNNYQKLLILFKYNLCCVYMYMSLMVLKCHPLLLFYWTQHLISNALHLSPYVMSSKNLTLENHLTSKLAYDFAVQLKHKAFTSAYLIFQHLSYNTTLFIIAQTCTQSLCTLTVLALKWHIFHITDLQHPSSHTEGVSRQ